MSDEEDWKPDDDFLDDFIPRNDPEKNISDPIEKENTKPEEEKSEKNKSPEVFQKPQNPIKLSLQHSQENTDKSVSENRLGISSQEDARANLINSFLKKASKRSESSSEESETEKCLLNSILKRSTDSSLDESPENQDNNLRKPSRSVSFSSESNEKEKRKKLIFDCLNKSKSKDHSISKDDSISKKESRCKDLRSYFKPGNDSTLKNNESKNNSRSRNDSKSTSKTKQVIVRKFSGPAGLLPDNLDFSNFPMAFLNSFDESENEHGLNESQIPNFCSQNTKNLFTGGAWQSMIDDLPVDFFQGQEIATIKRNAKNGFYKSERVPYMGAIIHHIDFSNIKNLTIVLKDSTDEIEASLHCDVWSLYPNSIEVGNVILLKDVGIITSRLYMIALIHSSDILAIYNEKERFVTSESMEKLLEDQEWKENCKDEEKILFNSELGIDDSFKKTNENFKNRHEEKNKENQLENEVEELLESQVVTENPEPALKKQKITETEILPGKSILEKTKKRENSKRIDKFEEKATQIFNEEDDEAFMTLNLEELSASQGPQHIASSTLIGSQISPGKKDKTPVKKRCDERKQTPKKSTMAEKLKQFRHKELLTQPEIENVEVEEKRPENKPETSNFADLLDFEDEMDEQMSQMDIDSLPENVPVSPKEDENQEKNNSGILNSFHQSENEDLEEEMSQIDFSFNPEKFQEESITRGNPENGGIRQNLSEDPVDNILSQMNVDDL